MLKSNENKNENAKAFYVFGVRTRNVSGLLNWHTAHARTQRSHSEFYAF